MPSAIDRAPSVMRSIGVVMVLDSRKGQQDRRESRPNIIACMTIWKKRHDRSEISLLVVRDIHDIVHRSVAVVVERNRDVHHAVETDERVPASPAIAAMMLRVRVTLRLGLEPSTKRLSPSRI